MRHLVTIGLVVVLMLGAVVCGARAGLYSDKNLAPNPSFELLDDEGNPVAWHFHDAGAGASFSVDDSVAHTGTRSVKFVNPHDLQPNVYGTFWARVKVEPKHTYTFSLYARSADPGAAWFGCGPKWERRRSLKPTGDRWQRFSLTFTTYENERYVDLRINVDSKTQGLWIDSVQLEEGDKATSFDMPPYLARGETLLKVEPARVGENLLKNGSFEEIAGKWPAHWRWDRRNTGATMTIDDTRAHLGKRSIKLTNPTPFHAQVYAQFLYAHPVKVKPNTTYTVSAYVLVESPGIAWVGGATRWRVRVQFPRTPTGGKWVRVQKSFTTWSNETEIRIMVITESPTQGLWVDDVKLEEGDQATPFVLGDQGKPRLEVQVAGRGRLGLPVNPWMPDRYPPEQYLFGQEVWVTGHLLPSPAGKTLRARLYRGGQLLASRTASVPAGPCAQITFARELSEVEGGAMRVELEVPGEALVSQNFRLITPATLREKARALSGGPVEQLRTRVKALGDRGAYPRVTLTVADNFLKFVAADIEHGEYARAWAELDTVDQIVRRALQTKTWPEAPKYVTSPVEIRGPSFVGTVRWPGGRTQRRPVIFIGMGPFGQARRDVDIFPDYGFNIMQAEFGPNSVLPSEDQYSDAAIKDFLKVCDRAAKAGVQVNLLISPHYFPNWALRKWPHLQECSGGFFRYCVHAPEAHRVIEKFLRYTIPRVKDHPALHSICLSNEPISTNLQKCRYVRQRWHKWLKRKYGTIEQLNTTWKSKYEDFDAIPVPPTAFKPAPIVYDFVRYNQEEFAGFHKFMADTIHEMAPDLPVHAKMMICAVFGPSGAGPWSIAPELFARFCQINGNDAGRSYRPQGEWATAWQDEIMGYELQRCAREAPVFNSEDHIIPDRNVNWQSPTYIYNVYWQGAIHGRGASSAWVWERTYDLKSSFCGSILHRPGCVEAAGHCTLDLNRLAEQVTALERVRPQVAVVYALAGYVWDKGYDDVMEAAWRASVFGGHKTGFVYERQLEALAEGQPLPEYISGLKVIVVAGLRHLSGKALRGLERFAASGGKIVVVGPLPDRDEHNQPARLGVKPAAQLKVTDDRQLVQDLAAALQKCGVTPPARLVDEQGRPVYGVDYFAAPWQGGWLVNASNYLRAEPRARLLIQGRPVAQATDLISGEKVTFPAEIPSLRPLLLHVK